MGDVPLSLEGGDRGWGLEEPGGAEQRGPSEATPLSPRASRHVQGLLGRLPSCVSPRLRLSTGPGQDPGRAPSTHVALTGPRRRLGAGRDPGAPGTEEQRGRGSLPALPRDKDGSSPLKSLQGRLPAWGGTSVPARPWAGCGC